METEVKELYCKRCGHKWFPRQSEVRICPRCKSPYWDKERQGENTKQKYPRVYKKWQNNHLGTWNEYQRDYNHNLRAQVLSHYGKGKCACVRCGFDDIRALSIDHINNNGSKHLKEISKSYGTSLYLWLRRNNFPLGFQTLCMNCQFIKNKEEK